MNNSNISQINTHSTKLKMTPGPVSHYNCYVDSMIITSLWPRN